MSAADPTPLDALAPDSRALLSLLLVQGRSYHQISELLKIDSGRVRERAHTAIEALAPGDGQPPAASARARIADYLVGEQSVSERARTRAQLAGSAPERVWAAAIASALAPLAGDALPAIPALGPHPEPSPPPEPDPPAPLDVPAASPARGVPDADPERRRPCRALITSLGLLAVAAAAVILVIVLHSDTGQRSPTAASGPASHGAAAARTINRLVLTAAGNDRSAVGAAAIVRQRRGGLLLLLQGRGLPANHRNSYAVWLFNTPADSRLLGFVSPAVGATGTFSSGTPLPDDAVRFRELVVTLETTSRPVAPGRALLQTPLALS